MKCITVLIAIALISAIGQSATIHVPGDEPTIQDAINSAVTGDTVLVAPGTYMENINFLGKSITVTSSGGNTVTTIDGMDVDSVVKFENGEGLDSILEGFTITNGAGNSTSPFSETFGGGIFCYSSSPTIRDNIIAKNNIEAFFNVGYGGGICCLDASPLIEKNLIWNNMNIGDSTAGGGIYSNTGSPVIIDNTILQNYSYGESATYREGRGGGIHYGGGSPTIRRNMIRANGASGYDAYGGGIYCYYCLNVIIENNLIVHNFVECSYKGGGDLPPPPPPPEVTGAGIYTIGTSADIINCNITDNTVLNFTGGVAGLVFDSGTMVNSIVRNNGNGDQMSSTSPLVTYSNIQGGYPGIGNIDEDPLFFNPTGFNYRLTTHSPCINRGTRNGAPGEDIIGSPRPFMGGVDMGAWEYVDVHSLQADLFSVSASSGGSVQFMLLPGPSHGGRLYAMFGSVSGTAPGFPLPGGQADLRLNWDLYTDFVYSLMNTPVFQDFYGHLTPGGTALAQLNAPTSMPPTAVGIVMYYAYCLGWPWEFVSNPVEVEILN